MANVETASDKLNTYHLEAPVDSRDTEATKIFDNLIENANLATHDEHNTTFLQAIKRYPKACAWSAVVTMTIIMDGYDTALMGSLFGFPAFTKKYGHQIGDTEKYALTGPWQMALGMAVPVGNVVGITLNAMLTDRFGHKRVLLTALVALSGLICIQFFAHNVETIFVGQILCGVPWGIFTTMAPAYASEVAPLALRSYLETWVVTCWGIGQFFSYAVLFSLNKRTDQWAYRIPFGVQWVWPAVIIPLAVFCPESPWWLVRTGQYDKAERTIRRLTSAKTKEQADDQAKKALALMIETNKFEVENGEKISYSACFATPSDRRRSEIAMVSWGLQVTTGFVIQGTNTSGGLRVVGSR